MRGWLTCSEPKSKPKSVIKGVSSGGRARHGEDARGAHLVVGREQRGVGVSLVVLAALLDPSPARAELRAIWALDDGTKVKQDATAHPMARGNAVFRAKPPRIDLFGARNETVAFQVMLVGGKRPTSGVRIGLDSIGPIRNEARSSDPDRFYDGRRIILFREHYVQVRRRSASLTWEPGSAAEPKGLSGFVPDPLSPLSPRDALQVPAERVQGIWVDVYIPKTVPAGTHRGAVQVSIDGKTCGLPACKIAVTLKVLPVTLPDVTRTKTMVYFSGGDNDRDAMPSRYFKAPWDATEQAARALRERHHRMGRRHRVTLFVGQDSRPNEELAALLRGDPFTRKAGYEGSGVGLGQDLYSIHTYGTHEGRVDSTRAKMWRDWLRKHGSPGLDFFLYVQDEPPRDDFPKINRLAKRAAPLPSFVTRAYDPALAVQIYAAPADHYSQRAARSARAAGKRVWIYNGVRPFTGSFMIDDVAVATRVNPWIQHKHGIERWFFWEATYYKDGQGQRGPVNVWREAWNFSNRDGDKQNGDGLLLYPGRDVVFPAESRGIDGPLPSIRLKNWRRGLEDVEYLVLARERGHGAFVDKLLRTMIPRALVDETSGGAPVSWPEEGDKWFRARRLLARLLEEGKPPPLPQKALAAPPEPLLQGLIRRVRQAPRQLGRKRVVLLSAAALGLLFGAPLSLWLWRRRRHKHASGSLVAAQGARR